MADSASVLQQLEQTLNIETDSDNTPKLQQTTKLIQSPGAVFSDPCQLEEHTTTSLIQDTPSDSFPQDIFTSPLNTLSETNNDGFTQVKTKEEKN